MLNVCIPLAELCFLHLALRLQATLPRFLSLRRDQFTVGRTCILLGHNLSIFFIRSQCLLIIDNITPAICIHALRIEILQHFSVSNGVFAFGFFLQTEFIIF